VLFSLITFNIKKKHPKGVIRSLYKAIIKLIKSKIGGDEAL